MCNVGTGPLTILFGIVCWGAETQKKSQDEIKSSNWLFQYQFLQISQISCSWILHISRGFREHLAVFANISGILQIHISRISQLYPGIRKFIADFANKLEVLQISRGFRFRNYVAVFAKILRIPFKHESRTIHSLQKEVSSNLPGIEDITSTTSPRAFSPLTYSSTTPYVELVVGNTTRSRFRSNRVTPGPIVIPS